MENSTIVKYYLVGSSSQTGCSTLVNDYIERGWVPFGSGYSSPTGYYCQPMVLYG